MAQLMTTMGLLDECDVARTLGFEDRPEEFVVWVEWRKHDVLVRRDAHVILKTPSATADVLAGGIG